MYFMYQGFTHKGDVRSFTFQMKDEAKFETTFLIHVDLLLFARHKVAMQEAPSFCLQLLTLANASAPGSLQKFEQYQVMEEDLLPLVRDRKRLALLKTMKPAARRFNRKPSLTSQFRPLSRVGV